MSSSPVLSWPKNYNEIPKEAFVREDIYKAEIDRIFYGPEWHPIAHEAEVSNKGDFKTTRLIDVPLLIVRGQDDVVRVFYNSCAHRGVQVETAPLGTKKEFECPFHRWVFSLEGALIGCPAQGDFLPGFDRKDFPLRQPRVEIFMGLIFVTLSAETEPLDEFLGDIKTMLATSLGGDGRLKLLGYQKVRYDSNWKAYIDADGYHPAQLHRAFRILNWQGGKGLQFTMTKRGHPGTEAELTLARNDGGVLKDPSLIEFKNQASPTGSRVAQLFPTFASVNHLNMISIRIAIPTAVDKTEVHYTYFAHQDDDEAMIRHRIRQSSNLTGPAGMVSLEDAAVFNRIHIGCQTPGAAIVVKGVRDPGDLPVEMDQNDEMTNLGRWEYYRSVMGFERAEA